MAPRPCPTCKGARLKPEVAGRHDSGRSIDEVVNYSILYAREFFAALEERRRFGAIERIRSDRTRPNASLTLTDREFAIGRQILKEIRERLGFLVDVGLDYLTLGRTAATLSGGEAQRIRLATQIGSGLMGVLYILDEPSIGLHQRDNARLTRTLKRLRDLGNTLIVVEHDEETMRAADWIIDMGPGAGEHGGRIVAQGTIDRIMAAPESLTGQFLSGSLAIDVPPPAQPRQRQARTHHRRAREQPEEHRRRDPARHARVRHGRLGLGQVVADPQHAVPGAGAAPVQVARGRRRARANRWPGEPGQGHRHRPVADRTHAAIESGDLRRLVHADQRSVRASARSARARLSAGAVLVQRQGRSMRSLRGRRHSQDRDAVPAGRVRPVRGVPRQALQPRDARDQVPRIIPSPTYWR